MGLLDDNLLTIITFFPLVTALGLVATSALGGFLGPELSHGMDSWSRGVGGGDPAR